MDAVPVRATGFILLLACCILAQVEIPPELGAQAGAAAQQSGSLKVVVLSQDGSPGVGQDRSDSPLTRLSMTDSRVVRVDLGAHLAIS